MRLFLFVLLVLVACTPPAARRGAKDYRLVALPVGDDSVAVAQAVARIEALPRAAFAADTLQATNGVTLRYRLLPPPDVRPGTRYPLVVVFHGAGEIGTDNEKQLDRFPLYWARPEVRARYPAYVLVPQMPERSALYNGPAGTPGRRSEAGPPLHAALELVDRIKATRPVDASRIYALGFSMGASTVWNSIGLRPDLFAAAIPIAGVPNPGLVQAVAQTPVWIIHGNADEANPIAQDREMFALLRAQPDARVRFWEFDGLWHAVPPALLAGEEFAAWLYSHRR